MSMDMSLCKWPSTRCSIAYADGPLTLQALRLRAKGVFTISEGYCALFLRM